MKAALVDYSGATPRPADFPDPVAGEGETLVRVLAAPVENFDRMSVAGTHYGSRSIYPAFPAVAGTGGVGVAPDGNMVLFRGLRPPHGAFAEVTVARFVTPVPRDVDPVMAAAVAAPVLTSLLPLKYAAALKPGETVWINGATGVTGRLATGVARALGAARVVATGRDAAALAGLRGAGCAAVIDLSAGEEATRAAFRDAAAAWPPDVVLDFLWGRPAALLIAALTPGDVGFPARQVRYLQLGDAAGAVLSLPAAALRTSGLVLQGAGPLSRDSLVTEMPRVWEGIRSGEFRTEIRRVPLSAISDAWHSKVAGGTRLVVIP